MTIRGIITQTERGHKNRAVVLATVDLPDDGYCKFPIPIEDAALWPVGKTVSLTLETYPDSK